LQLSGDFLAGTLHEHRLTVYLISAFKEFPINNLLPPFTFRRQSRGLLTSTLASAAISDFSVKESALHLLGQLLTRIPGLGHLHYQGLLYFFVLTFNHLK
jgi:hypothetical protein